MARPNLTAERRTRFLPTLAKTFAELGYRRTTTAELAERCGAQETVLYRLWPDKKAMFIAAIEYVYELSARIWNELPGRADDERGAAERLLSYEAKHHGEFGHYRIIFAGLSETDDVEIQAALRRVYARFQQFLSRQIAAHRAANRKRAADDEKTPPADLAAWAIIGLGTVANLGRELELLPARERERLFATAGRLLLEGFCSEPRPSGSGGRGKTGDFPRASAP